MKEERSVKSDSDVSSDCEKIYSEIKQTTSSHREPETHSDRMHVKENKLTLKGIYQDNSKKKKEIIYWQISAKEVGKFKPCLEAFIYQD